MLRLALGKHFGIVFSMSLPYDVTNTQHFLELRELEFSIFWIQVAFATLLSGGTTRNGSVSSRTNCSTSSFSPAHYPEQH